MNPCATIGLGINLESTVHLVNSFCHRCHLRLLRMDESALHAVGRKGSHEPLDLEAAKLLFRKCLANAEALLDSAKDSSAKKRNHIAFHLGVLALEEIGKAAMLLAHRAYPHVVEDEELDESKLSDEVADHRKKLFWALLTTSFDGGIFAPEDFIKLKEIANDIHFRRIESLYTNVDQALPEAEISDDELTRIIGLAESRLNLEKLREIRQLDSDAQQLLDWFMEALADPLLQRFVLSEQSRHKLAELTVILPALCELKVF